MQSCVVSTEEQLDVAPNVSFVTLMLSEGIRETFKLSNKQTGK